MSTAPVTLLVACRVAAGRYRTFLAWQREGEASPPTSPATSAPGRWRRPPAETNSDDLSLRHDATLRRLGPLRPRQAWLERGQGLFDEPRERRAHGLAAWFDDNRKPPRWKQSVAIGWRSSRSRWPSTSAPAPTSASCRWPRGCCSAPWSSPLMTYWFILSPAACRPGCTAARSAPPACRKRTDAAPPGGVGRNLGFARLAQSGTCIHPIPFACQRESHGDSRS